MEGSIEVKESKSNEDGKVWASSHSRVKPVSSKEHMQTSMKESIEVKESKLNGDREAWASSYSRV
eukprot:14614656-Ditylum_brightwellii.AAC.1